MFIYTYICSYIKNFLPGISLILNSVPFNVPQDFLRESHFTLDKIFTFSNAQSRQLRPSSFCLASDEEFSLEMPPRDTRYLLPRIRIRIPRVSRRVYQVVIETSRFTIAAALPVGAELLDSLFGTRQEREL